MYVSITGNKGNQDVYIKQSYRKDNGKTSSRIYKNLPVFHWTKNVSSTSAICSCNSYAPNCASTTSAEISVTTTGLLTISMPSLRI